MAIAAYGIAATPFGELLLATSDGAVVALSFGDSEAELTAWLQAEFPTRSLRRDDAGLHGALAVALDALDGDAPQILPLAAAGTDFQQRVWSALLTIPYGVTRTYTQLAAMVGRPNAVRAVASACASNPISVLVPCHRVVGADGTLRGYRWGLGRKRMLLEHERRAAPSGARAGMARSA